MAEDNSNLDFDPGKIERPHPILLRYYGLACLVAGPAAPLLFLQLWFRYLTLRYKFDDSGVSMKWGVLFRKEVYLTYRRIQDIHLTRNIVQRWMGLAKISLQTASGSSEAEMGIEGVLEAEELRDFLYGKMRGAKDQTVGGEQGVAAAQSHSEGTVGAVGATTGNDGRATAALEGIRDALQKLVAKQQGDAS